MPEPRAAPIIHVFTSFAANGSILGSHILGALRQNIENPSIHQVVVITETDAELLGELCGEIAHSKLTITSVHSRPTFDDIFAAANDSLESAACDVAVIMNGDISFLSESDTLNTAILATNLANIYEKVALCLTRYDIVDGEAKITLKNQLGLPNTLSADTWIITSPLQDTNSLYYSLGQMFCDKFLSHDLIKAGYHIFNPCLDCKTVHHEIEIKNLDYYRDLTNQEDSRASLQKHITASESGGHYYGISHVSSNAVLSGYRPRPMAIQETRQKIFVAVSSELSVDHLRRIITFYELVGRSFDRDVYFLAHHVQAHQAVESLLAELSSELAYCLQVDSFEYVLERMISGNEIHYSNAYCINQPPALTTDILDHFDTIFIAIPEPSSKLANDTVMHSIEDRLTNSKADNVDRSRTTPADVPYAATCASLEDREVSNVVFVSGLSELVCEYLAVELLQQEPMAIVWGRDYRFIREFRKRHKR